MYVAPTKFVIASYASTQDFKFLMNGIALNLLSMYLDDF